MEEEATRGEGCGPEAAEPSIGSNLPVTRGKEKETETGLDHKHSRPIWNGTLVPLG